MAVRLWFAGFLCIYIAFIVLPAKSSDYPEIMTCAYLVKARTSNTTGSGSHGAAYAYFTNSSGAAVELYLRRTYDTSTYNYVAGDAFYLPATGPCVLNICSVELEMDGEHSWTPLYLVVDNGDSTVSFTIESTITETATVFNNCDSSSTVRGLKPRNHRRSRN